MPVSRRSRPAQAVGANVMIRCPRTGDHVRTGFTAVSVEAFGWILAIDLEFTCESCGTKHVWSREDAFLRPAD